MSSKASTKANSVSSSRSTSRSSSFYGSTSLLPALLRNHEDNADSEASTPRDAHSSLSRTLLRQGSKHSQYSQLQDPLHALETAQGILQSMPGLARKGAGGCGNGSGDVAAAPWGGPGNDCSPRLRTKHHLDEDLERSNDSPRLQSKHHLDVGVEKSSQGLEGPRLGPRRGGSTPRKPRSVSWAHYDLCSALYIPPGAAPVQPSNLSSPTRGPVVPPLNLSKLGFSSLPPSPTFTSPTVTSARQPRPRRNSMLCYSSAPSLCLAEYSELGIEYILSDLALDSEALKVGDGRYRSTRLDTPTLFADSKRIFFRGDKRNRLPSFKLTPREVATSKEMSALSGQENINQLSQQGGKDGPREYRCFEGCKSSMGLSFDTWEEAGNAESPRARLPSISRAQKPSLSLMPSGGTLTGSCTSGHRLPPPPAARSSTTALSAPGDPPSQPFCPQGDTFPHPAPEPSSSPRERGLKLKGSLLPKLGELISPQVSTHPPPASQQSAVFPTHQCLGPPPFLSPTMRR
uniref:Uncharacterized protein n=1 Tax=Dunaliella tertiolecta TaxID=3047 RepID=A0A7S3RA42_DUNTE|mmetsp:Transcript_1807/g.4601  ORF Transcript_1807/g.4601 Transcript_1807/m.4601 type:complete len:516 (-) Transcript_1807:600-2147(-)|eukprot:CAMPEP_0202388290 /NCGR_PEP_ID=MMETSP1127-20130417/76677_1 /ASSEMBLY_ACC=CAM_ASM_000462 /TAXON_ID=3047 /ORGANISM="Dunaliella tertiolecta, Strain CCMP1320" /LENGTH=515 /DNA_ID=CAMNT_0048989639 /DNA_START=245 /DNA_END=1792 /DNA_ORIENTATION=-